MGHQARCAELLMHPRRDRVTTLAGAANREDPQVAPADAEPIKALERKIRRIFRDHDKWAAPGIVINSARILPDGSGIQIGIDPGDLAEVQVTFIREYGPGIEVVREGPHVWL